MIKAVCYTNLDKFKHKNWPTKFAAVPRVGDRVRAEGGVELKVVAVTWLCTQDCDISIELHH